jgi:hypothetical protein
LKVFPQGISNLMKCFAESSEPSDCPFPGGDSKASDADIAKKTVATKTHDLEDP